MINGMLARYAEKTLVLLCVSFVLLMAVLMLLYRRRFVKIILPSVLSVLVMFAVVSLFGENVNLFHLLSSFMIIGMSLDYSIFLSGDFKRAINPVVCALLTSVAGFGALAFVSFPIVRSLGVALAIGLPVSFIAAVALFMPAKECDERAATPVGMEILWLIYRLFGKRVLDIMVMLVANFVWLSDAKARRAAKSRRRLVNFALSLGDKLSVLSMGRGQPKIRLDESGDAGRFIADVAARKGVVVLSSHLGNIETLSAYGECSARFHVFMALSATGVFRAFKERHSCRSKIELHPTEGFGMAELFAGAEIVERGDVVLMAADRGGGRVKEMPFLGGKRKFPEGVFRFAHHLERPVYFVASLREAGGYRVYAKLLSGSDLLGDYVRELDRLVKMYPDQWYQWDNEKGENG
jgi:predicted LPLAT superfamily acyltransferase